MLLQVRSVSVRKVNFTDSMHPANESIDNGAIICERFFRPFVIIMIGKKKWKYKISTRIVDPCSQTIGMLSRSKRLWRVSGMKINGPRNTKANTIRPRHTLRSVFYAVVLFRKFIQHLARQVAAYRAPHSCPKAFHNKILQYSPKTTLQAETKIFLSPVRPMKKWYAKLFSWGIPVSLVSKIFNPSVNNLDR